MFAEHMKRANPWEENPFGTHHYPHHHHHHYPQYPLTMSPGAGNSSSAGTGTCSSEVAAAPHMIPIRIMEENYNNNHYDHNSPNSQNHIIGNGNGNNRNNSPVPIPMQMEMEMPDMDIPLEFKQPISKIEIPNCFRQAGDQARGGPRVMNVPPPLNMSSNDIPQQHQQSQSTLNQHSPFMDQQQQSQNRIPSPINSPSHTSGGAGGIRHIPIFLEGQQQQQQKQKQQGASANQNQNNVNNNFNNTNSIPSNNNNTANQNQNSNNSTNDGTLPIPILIANNKIPQQHQQQQQPVPIPIPLPPPITIIDELKQGRTPPSPPPRSPKNMKPNYNLNHNNNINNNSSDDLKSHRTTFPFSSNNLQTPTPTPVSVSVPSSTPIPAPAPPTATVPIAIPIPIPINTASPGKTSSSSPPPSNNNNTNMFNDRNRNNSNGTCDDNDSQANVPPPQKKPTPSKSALNTPIEKIQAISEDVKQLEKQVSEFTGVTKTKEFLFLDEMLTRNLIKLDDIEVGGKEDVRMARKECIKLVNNCINNLEAKVTSNSNNATEKNEKITAMVVAVQKNSQQSPPLRDHLGLGRGHQHHRSELSFNVGGEEKKSQNSSGGKNTKNAASD